MDKVKQIETVLRFSDFNDIVNTRFTKARCRMFYTGKNRNHTNITDAAVEKLIDRKGYANVPVVAHLYKGEDGKWRVGGHDSKFIIDADGNCEVVDETIPFGVIPENCNPSFEEVKEPSGEIRKYFCVDVILWTHRYNIMDAAKTDDIYFNQSMEIEFNSYYYDDESYCVIEDFDLSALCLLNHDPYNKENEVEPCFPSAAVGKFNLTKMSELGVMLDELKKIQNYNLGKMSPAALEAGDIPVQWGIQSLTEQSAALPRLATLNNGTSPLLNSDKEEIELDFEKIKSSLDTKYFAVQIIENSVIAVNKDTFKTYSVPFTVNDKDNEIVFDYDKTVEKYVSVSDKDTGFSVSEVKQYVDEYADSIVQSTEAQYAEKMEAAKVDAVKEITDKYNTLTSEYNKVKDRCEKAEQKISEYAAAEQKAEEDAHKAKIDSVINEYSQQLGTNAEYVLYKNSVDYSKTTEQVEKDMLVILGKYAKNGLSAANKYSVSWGVGELPKPTQKTNRYGNLFDDFKD